MFHSLSLSVYVHPPSLPTLITPYIFITPSFPSRPALILAPSLTWPLSFWPGYADNHRAVFQEEIQRRFFVTVRDLHNDVAILREINTGVCNADHLRWLEIGRDD